jgi:hypothetical protein
MSVLQSLLGNASQADPSQYQPLIEPILVKGEEVAYAFKTFRDLIIFTNARLVLIDVQGLTGKKKSFKSIPYSEIAVFTKESAGTFELDSEIDLYVRAHGQIELQFRKEDNQSIDAVYNLLSEYIIKPQTEQPHL